MHSHMMHQGGLVGAHWCPHPSFAEFAMSYNRLGTNLLVYPGAFNLVTGPPHWQLHARARAVDTQSYVLMCSPARWAHGFGGEHSTLSLLCQSPFSFIRFVVRPPLCPRDPNSISGYVAYGHSIVVDPWGEVLAEVCTSRQGNQIFLRQAQSCPFNYLATIPLFISNKSTKCHWKLQ